MKTLGRYISSAFIRNLILSVMVLTLLYTFNNLLADLLDDKFPVEKTLIYHAMGIPQILVEMIPPGSMVGTVLTLSGFGRSNELIACYSLGVGLRHIIGILLSIVFMVSCFSLVLQDRILPPIFRQRTTYYWREMKGKKDFYIDVKQSKVWYKSGNLIYNLRTFDPTQEVIYGMSVFVFDKNFSLLQVVDAKKAVHDKGSGWTLHDGMLTVFSEEDRFPLSRKFEERHLDIVERPSDFKEIEKEVDGLRLKELWAYVKRTRNAGVDTDSTEVRLHYRISLSFMPLIMSILAVPFAITGRRQGGVGRDLAIGFIVTFLYWLFYAVSLSLGKNGALPAFVAAWLPSVVFGIIAGFLLLWRPRQ